MTPSPRSRRRPFGALAGVAVVVVGAWTGGWFWLRGQIAGTIDQTLTVLAAQGIVVACPERAMGGWPFRIVVTCQAPSLRVAAEGLSVNAAQVDISGLVYQPNHFIVDVGGPLTATRGGDVGEARWRSLRFSLSLDKGALGRFSLETTDFDGRARLAGAPEQALKLASGEFHLMPAPLDGPVAATTAAAPTMAAMAATDYRVALIARQAVAAVGGVVQVAVPVDLDLDARTTDLPGDGIDPHGLADAGTGLDVARVRIGLGDVALDGGGRFTLGADGGVDGVLEVQPAGATSAAVDPAVSRASSSLKAAVAGTMMMFGTTGPSRTGRTGRRLDVVVDNGVVRVGRLTLARLRPLF